jgi:head-tail adaptor
MAIGAYRHRIEVQNPTPPVPDGDGGYTTDYAPADPPFVDASIESARASALERVTAGTVLATATHLIRTRFHPGISSDTRLVFEGRHFEVQSVLNVDQRDIALILICAEIKSEAVVNTTGPPSGIGSNAAPGWNL